MIVFGTKSLGVCKDEFHNPSLELHAVTLSTIFPIRRRKFGEKVLCFWPWLDELETTKIRGFSVRLKAPPGLERTPE